MPRKVREVTNRAPGPRTRAELTRDLEREGARMVARDLRAELKAMGVTGLPSRCAKPTLLARWVRAKLARLEPEPLPGCRDCGAQGVVLVGGSCGCGAEASDCGCTNGARVVSCWDQRQLRVRHLCEPCASGTFGGILGGKGPKAAARFLWPVWARDAYGVVYELDWNDGGWVLTGVDDHGQRLDPCQLDDPESALALAVELLHEPEYRAHLDAYREHEGTRRAKGRKRAKPKRAKKPKPAEREAKAAAKPREPLGPFSNWKRDAARLGVFTAKAEKRLAHVGAQRVLWS